MERAAIAKKIITLKEQSNLLSLRNTANCMSGAAISRKDRLFIPWLVSIPHTNHWLSVNGSDLQTNPRKSLYVLRASRDTRGRVTGIRPFCCWELGTRPRLAGEEAKKGVWGWKGCWKPSGKPRCRKCHEHNCRRKTARQLLPGGLAKEEPPGRGWGEPWGD